MELEGNSNSVTSAALLTVRIGRQSAMAPVFQTGRLVRVLRVRAPSYARVRPIALPSYTRPPPWPHNGSINRRRNYGHQRHHPVGDCRRCWLQPNRTDHAWSAPLAILLRVGERQYPHGCQRYGWVLPLDLPVTPGRMVQAPKWNAAVSSV